ncbi:hypothetical protein C8R48DRAFT_674521 [Suillus tomentosus]|nr:hypothetical protein C8R48DRAFT_674521 [Suillus tomentosus]
MDKDNRGDFTFAKPHNTSSQKLEGPISHPSVSGLLGNTELRIHGAQSWSCAFLKNHDLSFINDSKNGLVNIPPLSLPLNAHMDIMVIDADKSSVFKSSLYSNGDDAHQDQFVLQLFTLVDQFLRREYLYLKLIRWRLGRCRVWYTLSPTRLLQQLSLFVWFRISIHVRVLITCPPDISGISLYEHACCGSAVVLLAINDDNMMTGFTLLLHLEFNFAINSSKSNSQPKAGSGAHCQMAADPKRAGVVSGSCHMVRYGEDGGGGGSMGHEGDGDSMGDGGDSYGSSMGDGGSMGDGDGMGDNGDGSDWGDGDNGGASGG